MSKRSEKLIEIIREERQAIQSLIQRTLHYDDRLRRLDDEIEDESHKP